MRTSDIVNYYSKKGIAEAILSIADGREVVPRYRKGSFGKRPQILQFKKEITDIVWEGATSFHASEERWTNPALLSSKSSRKDMDSIRVGWDLIFDIDTKFFEYAKACTELLVDALKFHGVNSYSVKFSGGTGFHVAVPFEAFPPTVGSDETKKLFPELPQMIAMYLRKMIKNHLSERIIEIDTIDKICKLSGKPFSDLVEKEEGSTVFNPYSVLEIDTIALAPRHLFRMPYCLNEKSWLVSVPLETKDLADFKRDMAKPGEVQPTLKFLDKRPKKHEAKSLVIRALEWNKEEDEKPEEKREFPIPDEAIPDSKFPPCIKLILKGMEDGRKRSVFILANFLRTCGWSPQQIEKEIMEWNKRNAEPLKEGYIKSQLNWHKRVKGSYLPPNCDNRSYYVDIGVCKPDSICATIKNPTSYSFKLSRKRKKKR
jgi:hypothetical protein